jgi:hypothetical protein
MRQLPGVGAGFTTESVTVPFVPHARRDPGFFVDAPVTARDPLSRFEQMSAIKMGALVSVAGIV